MVALLGCHDGSLQQASDDLSASADQVDFGSAYVNRQAVDRVVTIHNKGRATASVTYVSPGAPFELLTSPDTMNPGDTLLRLRFRPLSVAMFSDQLELISGGQHLVVALQGTGAAVPSCGIPDACHERQFDVSTNRCIDSVEADGTSCDPHDLCMSSGSCLLGRCVGKPVDCDDHNACTVDSCNAVLGCQHSSQNACPSSGPCMVGVCEPATGCGVAPVVDGTPCGHMQTCDAAQVCVSGACTIRNPPDGFVCAEASPCQGRGICQGSTCVRGVATPIVETWRFDSLETQDAGDLDLDAGADSGFNPVVLQDFAMNEDTGDISLMGFGAVPMLRANTASELDAPGGGARRCLSWNDRLICEDYPGNANGQVTAIDRNTGDTLWSFVLSIARPDFRDECDNLFMARMAVLGSDRIAALFEGYPKGQGSGTTCRLYFLTVLDASGGLVTSTQLTDPELNPCDHPHPYGFESDTTGNFYIGFAPTMSPSGGPPLHPDVGTTVMSFTRDGTFRWKFTDLSLVGGEMAVANGVLYPENGTQAISTTTGQSVAQLSEPFGRTVLTQNQMVLAPVDMATAVNGYTPGSAMPLWSHTLAPGTKFWGDQLRLAKWATSYGSTTVALGFTNDGTTPMLHAFYVDDGTDAFSCPLQMNARGSPQLFEVGNGKMSLMEGAVCEKCDPPFAGSSGAFHSFDVPTLSPANAPWTGTFGGAGHDGQENLVVQPVQPGN